MAGARQHLYDCRGGRASRRHEQQDGVLVVDGGLEELSEKVLAAIRSISKGPIRYLVNTQYHPDPVGGNEAIRKAGSTISGGNVAFDLGANASEARR